MSSRNIIVFGATVNAANLNEIQREYIETVKLYNPSVHWTALIGNIPEKLLNWVTDEVSGNARLIGRDPRVRAATMLTDICAMDIGSPDVNDSYLTKNWIDDYNTNYTPVVEDADGNITLRIVAHCSNSGWLEICVFYSLFKDLLKPRLIYNLGYVLIDEIYGDGISNVQQLVISTKKLSDSITIIDNVQLIDCLTTDPVKFTAFSDFSLE